jgi:hypothetical protein
VHIHDNPSIGVALDIIELQGWPSATELRKSAARSAQIGLETYFLIDPERAPMTA